MNQAVVVNVETIQEAPTRAEDAPPPVDLPDINREIVKTREERTTARAETEKANINVNVAVRDQFIYGELCKTMPCQWMQKSENEQAILVMEQVRRASRENNRSASLGPHATLTRESVLLAPRLYCAQVLISPPFTPESCQGKSTEKHLLERVRKVLGGILQKIEADGPTRQF